MGSSWTRGPTSVLCRARQILNHWTTRDALFNMAECRLSLVAVSVGNPSLQRLSLSFGGFSCGPPAHGIFLDQGCIGRRILNHWTIPEIPSLPFFFLPFLPHFFLLLALFPLRPSPIPKEMEIIWAWTQQPLPGTAHSSMGLGSRRTIILEASVKVGLAWPPRGYGSEIGGG